MRINVTADQLAAAIQANEDALVHAIRDCGRSHPPGDGAIATLVANIKALREIEPAFTSPLAQSVMSGEAVFVDDEVDVGATDKGERVTVKRRVVHGRKEG